MRKVLPISLILTVALLGCSLNRTPGDGQPVTATPSMGTATTPGTSYGNRPMTSSYATPSTSNADRAAQAAQIMRDHQLYQPRFLGYLNPTPRVQSMAQQAPDSSLYLSPSQQANPQLTVNSSISSGPYPVVTGGSDAVVLPAGTTVTGTTAATTGTTGAVTAASTVAGTTGTTATTNATSIPLNPTLTSGATISPNVASSALPGMASASGATSTTATTAPSTTTAVRTGTAQLTVPSSTVNLPLNVTTTRDGQIMISNVKR